MSRVKKHFDKIAKDYDFYKKKNEYYYRNLKSLLTKLITRNKNVLEVGCGTGDLISFINPKKGYGMDLSTEMIKIAKNKHKGKNIVFSTKYPKGRYDVVFMSDVIEHLEDPKKVFEKISSLLKKKGVFVNTMANPIWEPILMVGEKVGVKMPEGEHRRISFGEIRKLLEKVNLKIVKHDYKLLIPVKIPFITVFANKYLERYLKKYAFIEYFVAEKK